LTVLDNRTKSLIRGLVYPIQFDGNPIDGVDRVLTQVVDRKALGATPGEFLASVRAALESSEPLADLIPQHHPEPVIRAYLAEIQKRLEKPA